MAHRQKTATSAETTFESLIATHCTDSIVFTNPEGTVVWANEPFTEMSGYSLDEMRGKTPGSVLQGEATDPETVLAIRKALKERRHIRCEIVNYSKAGRAYWIDLTINPIFDADGRLTHFMSLERDVTDRYDLIARMETALRVEHERRRERRMLSQMSEWLFAAQDMAELQQIVTLSMGQLFPGSDGVLYIFSNSRDVLDRVSDWGNVSLEDRVLSPQHVQPNACWALRRGRPYAYGTTEIDFRCSHISDAGHVSFCLPIIAHGDTIGLMSIGLRDYRLDDTTAEERKKDLSGHWDLAMICAEQISLAAANVRFQLELQDRSVRDPLTGMWNRRWFLETASQEMKQADRAEQPFSLVSIDVDRFKEFNDRHGHDAGDMVLKMIGQETGRHLPDNVYACRLGGEEFALICPRLTASEAASVAERFRRHIAGIELVHAGGRLPRVGFSAGVAQLRKGETLSNLLRRSDELLYRAKDEGRERVLQQSEQEPVELSRAKIVAQQTSA